MAALECGRRYSIFGNFRISPNISEAVITQRSMADFDAIYEEDDERDRFIDDTLIISVPDPVVVRGAGNITV